MKSPYLIAAACCLLLAIVAGFIPAEHRTQADSLALAASLIEAPSFDSQALAEYPSGEIMLTEFDTSVPAEEPDVIAEAPDTVSAINASCPANSSSNARSSYSRNGVFDGDGRVFDRGGPVRNLFRKLLGVDRRQARRAAGRGVFGRR